MLGKRLASCVGEPQKQSTLSSLGYATTASPIGKGREENFPCKRTGKATAFRFRRIEEMQWAWWHGLSPHLSSHALGVFQLLGRFICYFTSIACIKGANDSHDGRGTYYSGLSMKRCGAIKGNSYPLHGWVLPRDER
jgi:hypothetical protein